ncbi:hypothetical protein E4V51_33635, partial [Paenibacillus sp. 28ISP30-2]|nr:hypothetical protein [Paenibacillus sp. 28ISP30-2]
PPLRLSCHVRLTEISIDVVFFSSEDGIRDIQKGPGVKPCVLLEKGAHTVSIGTPLANQSVYILNTQQQLVPIGIAGELYIGGAGVGRGYLNLPELTAEKFIPNPFAQPEAEQAAKPHGKGTRLNSSNVSETRRPSPAGTKKIQ